MGDSAASGGVSGPPMDSGWIDDTKLWPMVQRSFVYDYMVKAIDQDGKPAQNYRGFAEGINLFGSGNVGKALCQSKDGICSIKLCSKLQCWTQCFTFSAPTASSADEIIDAIEETVEPGGLETLQHQGGAKFIAAVASAAAAVKLSSRGSFVLNGASIPVAQVGPRVLYISAFRVPPYAGDATLAATLSTYGKVLAIQESQFKGRPTVGTGVRVIRMEMEKPVPNF
ncbi:hypothetical protein HPB49_024670 [Dermacentor silvarum]|uniref:Uncharacterized protein n=1 Tax=Dermacentor silvarum TaxID=543639 RepID=A0ACB8E3U0_DERSI|nr:hypothetical protein HPB49_024670 [Dermacentor silvarum]